MLQIHVGKVRRELWNVWDNSRSGAAEKQRESCQMGGVTPD